jgi:hypothetical protein
LRPSVKRLTVDPRTAGSLSGSGPVADGRHRRDGRYAPLGIEQILTGFEHMLFVLALVILVKGKRRLLWTVTAFTTTHSITSALATLGFTRAAACTIRYAHD